jgi:hypothetical protein
MNEAIVTVYVMAASVHKAKTIAGELAKWFVIDSLKEVICVSPGLGSAYEKQEYKVVYTLKGKARRSFDVYPR